MARRTFHAVDGEFTLLSVTANQKPLAAANIGSGVKHETLRVLTRQSGFVVSRQYSSISERDNQSSPTLRPRFAGHKVCMTTPMQPFGRKTTPQSS